MDPATPPPPELGLMMGALAVDSAVTCPMARFGRVILQEMEVARQGAQPSSASEVVVGVSQQCAADEAMLGQQLEQLTIARDKLASELQRVEAQIAVAAKKKSEAETFRSYCKMVQGALVAANTDGGAMPFSTSAAVVSHPPSQSQAAPSAHSRPVKAGSGTSEATNYFDAVEDDPEPQMPTHHPPATTPHPGDQQHGPQEATRHGEIAEHNVAVRHAAPPHSAEGGPHGEMQQVISLLQLPDVKEQTVTHALSRCESFCLLHAETPWTDSHEFDIAQQLSIVIVGHLLQPRPPLQILELRILTASQRRMTNQAVPRGSKFHDIPNAVATVGKMMGSVNDDVQLEAITYLMGALASEENKMEFGNSEGLPDLLHLVANSTNELVLEKALELMYSILTESRALRLAVLQGGGLQPTLDLLYTDSTPILDNIVLTLGFLTREEEAKVAIRECGGLDKLVASLFHYNETIVARAAGVIWNCSSSKDNRYELRALGAIPALLNLVKGADSTEAVVENAAGALWNLTSEPDFRNLVAEYMGIPALVSRLSSDNVAVLDNVTGTLWNCSATIEVRAAIRKCNGLPVLLKLLTHHSPTVQENAAGVLRNSAINDQNKLTLREHGAVELMLDLVRTVSHSTRDKLVSTLWILTVAPENKHAVRTSNGFPILVDLLRMGAAEDAVIIEKSLGVLRNCAMVAENRTPMLEAGVVKALAAIGRHPERLATLSTSVREMMAQVVQQLARDEKAAVKRDGGLSLVVTLLDDADDAVIDHAANALTGLTSSNAENRDAVRDAGGLDRLLKLLQSASAAITTVGAGAPKALHSSALHSVLMAIRNACSSNPINQRLCAERDAVGFLLRLLHTFGDRKGTANPDPNSRERQPEDIVREALNCLKNVASERLGCDGVQQRNGIPLITKLAETSESESVRKGATMVLQSLSRMMRIQNIGTTSSSTAAGGSSSGGGLSYPADSGHRVTSLRP